MVLRQPHRGRGPESFAGQGAHWRPRDGADEGGDGGQPRDPRGSGGRSRRGPPQRLPPAARWPPPSAASGDSLGCCGCGVLATCPRWQPGCALAELGAARPGRRLQQTRASPQISPRPLQPFTAPAAGPGGACSRRRRHRGRGKFVDNLERFGCRDSLLCGDHMSCEAWAAFRAARSSAPRLRHLSLRRLSAAASAAALRRPSPSTVAAPLIGLRRKPQTKRIVEYAYRTAHRRVETRREAHVCRCATDDSGNCPKALRARRRHPDDPTRRSARQEWRGGPGRAGRASIHQDGDDEEFTEIGLRRPWDQSSIIKDPEGRWRGQATMSEGEGRRWRKKVEERLCCLVGATAFPTTSRKLLREDRLDDRMIEIRMPGPLSRQFVALDPSD